MVTMQDIQVGNIYSTRDNELWECNSIEVSPKEIDHDHHIVISDKPIFDFINISTHLRVTGYFEEIPQFIEQWMKK